MAFFRCGCHVSLSMLVIVAVTVQIADNSDIIETSACYESNRLQLEFSCSPNIIFLLDQYFGRRSYFEDLCEPHRNDFQCKYRNYPLQTRKCHLAKKCDIDIFGTKFRPYCPAILAGLYQVRYLYVKYKCVDPNNYLFKEQPMDTQVNVGETVILRCIADKNRGIVSWTKGNISLVDASGETLDPRLKIIKEPGKGIYHLEISELKISDDDIYQCHVGYPSGVFVGKSPQRGTAKLTVLAPPEGPRITKEKILIADENDISYVILSVKPLDRIFNLTCSSTKGNPPPELLWTKNNQIINGDSVKTFHGTPDGVVAVLSLHLEAPDDETIFTCTMIHDFFTESPRTSIMIQLLPFPNGKDFLIKFKPKKIDTTPGRNERVTVFYGNSVQVASIVWKIKHKILNRRRTLVRVSCQRLATIQGRRRTTASIAAKDKQCKFGSSSLTIPRISEYHNGLLIFELQRTDGKLVSSEIDLSVHNSPNYTECIQDGGMKCICAMIGAYQPIKAFFGPPGNKSIPCEKESIKASEDGSPTFKQTCQIDITIEENYNLTMKVKNQELVDVFIKGAGCRGAKKVIPDSKTDNEIGFPRTLLGKIDVFVLIIVQITLSIIVIGCCAGLMYYIYSHRRQKQTHGKRNKAGNCMKNMFSFKTRFAQNSNV